MGLVLPNEIELALPEHEATMGSDVVMGVILMEVLRPP